MTVCTGGFLHTSPQPRVDSLWVRCAANSRVRFRGEIFQGYRGQGATAHAHRHTHTTHSHSGGLLTKLCPILVTPWAVAPQASLSMRFSRQGYWSELPFPLLGDVPSPGSEPGSPVQENTSAFSASTSLSLPCK